MKVKIKATGEIINVEQYGDAYAEVLSSCSEENFPEVYNFDELEFINEPDWQHYRIQAAIAAMQGMLANPEHHKTQVESGVPCSYFYAVNAVMCADDLIAELQKKGEQDEND